MILKKKKLAEGNVGGNGPEKSSGGQGKSYSMTFTVKVQLFPVLSPALTVILAVPGL